MKNAELPSPTQMSPRARAGEIAQILAAAITRTRAGEIQQESQVQLAIPPERSVHTTFYPLEDL